MSLIEAYEEQYQGLVKSINEKLDRLAKLGSSSGLVLFVFTHNCGWTTIYIVTTKVGAHQLNQDAQNLSILMIKMGKVDRTSRIASSI